MAKIVKKSLKKPSKKLPKTMGISTIGYAIVFDDGSIEPRWIYESKKQAREFFPGEWYGDCSTWRTAKSKDGFRVKKVLIKCLE